MVLWELTLVCSLSPRAMEYPLDPGQGPRYVNHKQKVSKVFLHHEHLFRGKRKDCSLSCTAKCGKPLLVPETKKKEVL